MSEDKIISVDIGASKIRVQAIDRNGLVSLENYTGITGLTFDNERFIDLIINDIKSVLDKESGQKIAVGVGIPGTIEPEEGIIKNMPNIKGVKDLSIKKILMDKFNLPVLLLNDADAAGFSEWMTGVGKGSKNMVYLTFGTGVGSSIILDGKIQENSELGHIFLMDEGEERKCRCGKTNCAETFLGTVGLSRIYSEVFNIDTSKLTDTEINLLSIKMRGEIDKGNTDWFKFEDKYTDYLSIFLKKVWESYKPDTMVLGGGIILNNPSLLNKLLEKIKPYKIGPVLSSLHDNNVNLGVAEYAFMKLGQK